MSLYRKVIRICAEDSPNVKRALLQQSMGQVPDGRTVLQGVLPWDEYLNRRRFWDPVKQCIGLDARFYTGAQLLLFPPEWLDRAEELGRRLRDARVLRRARALGIDPAEGGDMTTMAVVDELGLIEMVSRSTPDTAMITTYARECAERWGIPWDRVCFDRGGGGQQHADRLRAMGCRGVRTVAFGETIGLDPKRGLTQTELRMHTKEERYEYKNRRAQMYGELSELLNPSLHPEGFALHTDMPVVGRRKSLRNQLAVMPKLYDGEDRLVMLPKNLPTQDRDIFEQAGTDTLVGLIGHSPDEADALVLAVHGMLHKRQVSKAGAAC